ncbi:MAG: hypothetical protein L0213_07975, partial [Candidatus Dadabacteria bacterium]|nr:hypothetical protein [Candidatus Dadabacteria bacterium]
EVELEPHEPFLPDDKAICVRKRELAIDLDAFEVQNSRVPMERRPFVDDVLEVDRVEGKELSVMGRKPRTIIFPKANINKTKGFLYEKKP